MTRGALLAGGTGGLDASAMKKASACSLCRASKVKVGSRRRSWDEREGGGQAF